MLERADTPAVRSFVRTIVQGERHGVSIGQMLRSLAEDMRKHRRAGGRGEGAQDADQDPVPARVPAASRNADRGPHAGGHQPVGHALGAFTDAQKPARSAIARVAARRHVGCSRTLRYTSTIARARPALPGPGRSSCGWCARDRDDAGTRSSPRPCAAACLVRLAPGGLLAATPPSQPASAAAVDALRTATEPACIADPATAVGPLAAATTGKVSHAGWPAITGALLILDDRWPAWRRQRAQRRAPRRARP